MALDLSRERAGTRDKHKSNGSTLLDNYPPRRCRSCPVGSYSWDPRWLMSPSEESVLFSKSTFCMPVSTVGTRLPRGKHRTRKEDDGLVCKHCR